MRIILLFWSFVFAFNLNAQYTITSSSAPVVGDIEAYAYTYTTGLVSPASGTNTLWNYSTITIDPNLSISSSTYIPATSVPTNTLFTGATIAADYGANNYAVFKINTTSNDFLGFATSTASSTTVYSDPMTNMKFPFSYGGSFTDNYAYSGTGYSLTGVITANANGTGTLIIPGYTLTNVLKVSVTQTETIVFTSSSATYSVIQDYFYSLASKFILFGVSSYTNIQGSSTSIGIQGAINTMIPLGVNINESYLDNSYTIYPNPVNDQTAFINFNNKDSKDINVLLLNTLGQAIKQYNYKNLSFGENKLKIDLKNIPTGIYSLQISLDGIESVKKLIVE